MVTGREFAQADEWWSYRGTPMNLAAAFGRVLALLKDHGEAWFEAMTTIESFAWGDAYPSGACSSDHKPRER